MVGPEEAAEDPMLEAETKQECSKYGSIQNCVIHVIQGENVPEDQVLFFFPMMASYNNLAFTSSRARISGRSGSFSYFLFSYLFPPNMAT